MSKKSSKTSYLAEQRKAARLEKERIQNRNRFIKKSITVLGCIIAAVLVTVLCVNLVLDSGITLNSAVIEGENFTVTKGMFSYYIYEQYEYFLEQYGDSLNALSFDKDKPLKKQAFNEKQSFFEYFADAAYGNVLAYVYYSEAALKAGFDLSDDIKQALKTRAEGYDTSLYGRGVDTEDIYEALYLSALAAEYNAKLYEENAATLEEIEKYKEKNPVNCQRVDYLMYSVKYSKDDKAAEEKAKTAAENIALSKDAEEFKLAAVNHYTNGKIDVFDEDDEAVKKVIDGMKNDSVAYTSGTLGDWLFREAEANGTKVIQDTTKNCYNVYMLITAPYFDTQKTVNIRHILVSLDDFDTKEEAKAEAERILAEFNGGSEDDFAALATRYSADPGSSATGGLYKRVVKGQMVEEFDAWCFDETRKAGDTGIVATSYGYHVMYFSGNSILNWQLDYYNETADAAASKIFTDITEDNSLTEKQDSIYSIPERKKK